jgi:hypothetical protein
MKAETWFTGAEAVEHGFADALTPEDRAAKNLTRWDLRAFTNAPPNPPPQAGEGEGGGAPAPRPHLAALRRDIEVSRLRVPD